jgi:hypothetical protein
MATRGQDLVVMFAHHGDNDDRGLNASILFDEASSSPVQAFVTPSYPRGVAVLPNHDIVVLETNRAFQFREHDWVPSATGYGLLVVTTSTTTSSSAPSTTVSTTSTTSPPITAPPSEPVADATCKDDTDCERGDECTFRICQAGRCLEIREDAAQTSVECSIEGVRQSTRAGAWPARCRPRLDRRLAKLEALVARLRAGQDGCASHLRMRRMRRIARGMQRHVARLSNRECDRAAAMPGLTADVHDLVRGIEDWRARCRAARPSHNPTRFQTRLPTTSIPAGESVPAPAV